MFCCIKVAFQLSLSFQQPLEFFFKDDRKNSFLFLLKLSDVSDTELAATAFELEFVQLMYEAGETRVVAVSHSKYIILTLMYTRTKKNLFLLWYSCILIAFDNR